MFTVPQRLTMAVQHHEAKRLDEAEDLYRGILQQEPRHPHALHLLGVVAHQKGRPEEAIGLISQALSAHGPHPVFYSNLASALLAAGRLAEAEANCRAALRLMPELGDAHCNLGAVLQRQGRHTEADAAFAEAERLRSRPAAARPSQSDVAASPQLPALLEHMRARVRLDPEQAEAQRDLGIVLVATGMIGDAVAHFREALRLQPNYVDAHSDLGAALSDLNQVEAAIESFREALRLDPFHFRARNNLAAALQFQGRTGEALAEYGEAVRLDPNNAEALFALSRMAAEGHYRFSDQELQRMRELAARADLPLADACKIHFALAQVFDRLDKPGEAFAECRAANEARAEINRRTGVGFDAAAHRRHVDRLMAFFTPAYFERVASFGLDTELPIFIVGMMRSGTTLAEQILASHPQVHGAGELLDIAQLVVRLPERLATNASYPECLARLDAESTRAFASAHCQMLRRRGGQATRVIDKFPLNFLHLGVIATLFPKARIVHCVRDPLDTCLSCYFQNFADAFPFKQDLGDLGGYYRQYQRLMQHWRILLPVPIFELHYEELTTCQEPVSRRLVEYCGLEWNERCLRFNETERPVRTASALQVRKPMYSSAVGRWKRYEPYLQPLVEALRCDGD
jgi:tetratricopeptide (TPR) repeat protein